LNLFFTIFFSFIKL